MKVTIRWREIAERESHIDVDPELGHHRIHALAVAHADALAKAADAERIEAVSWETHEPATRFGGTFG